MFKVPEWETDVPKANVNFTKKVNNKKLKNVSMVKNSAYKCVESPQHDVKVTQSDVNTKITNGKVKKTKKKTPKKHKQKNGSSSEVKHEDIIKEAEGLEMDEILVNAKKKKLNEIYKKEDCEELLFGDDSIETESESKSPENIKQRTQTSKLTNGNISNKKATKRKPEIDNSKNINRLTINAKKVKLNDTSYAENELKGKKDNNNTNQDITKKVKRIESKHTNGNDKKVFNKDQSSSTNIEKHDIKVGNDKKKEKIKKLFKQNNRTPINIAGNKLRERMMERLKAAQFRYLNEKLYTSSGNEAQQIFQSDPEAFRTYHQGYQQQVKKWPVNPLDVIVKKILKMPKSFVVADMGCGEAALSKRVGQKVHSFDLVATAPGVVACDMARTPLLKESTDVVVYCLALMGTELTQYLLEANRVLKNGGQLLIAEVESRFDDVNNFTKEVERLGFKLKNLDKEHSVFFFMHFVKVKDPPVKKAKLPVLSLKPCLYKKR